MFEKDYAEHRAAAAKIPGFDKLNNEGKKALIDLTFNMGANWVKVKGFKRFEAAMSQPVPDLEKAAESLEDSLWYRQVKDRAPTVVGNLRAGLDGTNLPREGMFASVKPAPTIRGVSMDGEARKMEATKATSVSAAPVVISAPTNSTTVASNSGPKTPLPRASVTSSDDAWVRTANRDTRHPIHG